MDDLHLSADARRRLEEELEWRSGDRRREISAWIERAREHGDIRENADYDAAKNDQGHNESRVRQLEDMLRRAVQVESVAGDVVEPGTVVEVKIEGDDETTVYLVGSIEERHETYDVLSTGSPLGRAVPRRGPGEVVTYAGPRRASQAE